MSAFNIYFLRDIFNEQYDIDIEHTIECLKEDLKDYPSILEEQLEMVENCQRDGCSGLRGILESITKSWLEVQSDETQLRYYNTMCNERFYDDAFVYTMEEFWEAVKDQGLEPEEIAEHIENGRFFRYHRYAMFNGDGDFISAWHAEDLIGEFDDVAEFMVEEDLLDEVK